MDLSPRAASSASLAGFRRAARFFVDSLLNWCALRADSSNVGVNEYALGALQSLGAADA